MRHFRFQVVAACLIAASARCQTNSNSIPREAVIGAEQLSRLDFSDEKIDLMLPGLKDQADTLEALRKFPLSNSVPPAILFNPIPVGMKFESERKKFKTTRPGKVNLPGDLNDLAFYSIGQLAELIKTRQSSSER